MGFRTNMIIVDGQIRPTSWFSEKWKHEVHIQSREYVCSISSRCERKQYIWLKLAKDIQQIIRDQKIKKDVLMVFVYESHDVARVWIAEDNITCDQAVGWRETPVNSVLQISEPFLQPKWLVKLIEILGRLLKLY